MFEIINFIILNFTTDVLICFLVKKILKLNVKKIEIVFMQIIMLAPAFVYVFLSIHILQFIILKLVAQVILCFLLTDSFAFSEILKINSLYIILSFSIQGFLNFIILFVSTLYELIFLQKLNKNYEFLIVFVIMLYFKFLSSLTTKLSKDKTLKNYLSKVSLSLFNKHIEIIGLLDSGNSLIDTVTGKPVIILSENVLRKYFSDIYYSKVLIKKSVSRKVTGVVAGGFELKIPIIESSTASIIHNGQKKVIDCVIGMVDQKFYDEKQYDCLLHRDFI